MSLVNNYDARDHKNAWNQQDYQSDLYGKWAIGLSSGRKVLFFAFLADIWHVCFLHVLCLVCRAKRLFTPYMRCIHALTDLHIANMLGLFAHNLLTIAYVANFTIDWLISTFQRLLLKFCWRIRLFVIIDGCGCEGLLLRQDGFSLGL